MGNKQGGHAQDGHSGDAVDPSELEYQDKLAAGALEADRAQEALAKALAAAGGLIGDDDDLGLGLGDGDGDGEEGEEEEEGEEDVELTEADLKDPALLKALKDLGGNVAAVAAPPSRADMAALAKRLMAAGGGGGGSEQARRFVARRIVANERTVAAVEARRKEGEGEEDEEVTALLAVYTEKRNRFLEDACDLEEGEETVVVPEEHGMTAEVMAEMMALGWEAPKASAKPAASFVLTEEVSGAVERLDGVVSVAASALSDRVVRNEKEVFTRRARAIELKKAGKTPEAKAEAKAMTEGQALRKQLLEEAEALCGAAEAEKAKAKAEAEAAARAAAAAANEEKEKAAAAAAVKAAAEKPPTPAEEAEGKDEATSAAASAAPAPAAPAKPLAVAEALLPQLDARVAAADAAGDAASAEAARGHAATLSALVAEVRAAKEEAKGAAGMVQMRLLRTIKAADAPLTEAAAAARDELAKEITAKPAAAAAAKKKPAVDEPAVAALRSALLLLVDCHRATALERTDGVVRFTKEAEKAVRMLRGATAAGGGVAAPDALEATVAQMRKTVAPLAGEAAAEGYEEADVECLDNLTQLFRMYDPGYTSRWNLQQSNLVSHHLDLPSASEEDWAQVCASMGVATTVGVPFDAACAGYACGAQDAARDLALCRASTALDLARREAIKKKQAGDLAGAREAAQRMAALKKERTDLLEAPPAASPAAAAVEPEPEPEPEAAAAPAPTPAPTTPAAEKAVVEEVAPPVPRVTEVVAVDAASAPAPAATVSLSGDEPPAGATAFVVDAAAARRLFDMYDVRKTGCWGFKEACLAARHLNGPAVGEDQWAEMCGQLGVDAEAGLPFEVACQGYLEGADDVRRDLRLCELSLRCDVALRDTRRKKESGDVAGARESLLLLKKLKDEKDAFVRDYEPEQAAAAAPPPAPPQPVVSDETRAQIVKLFGIYDPTNSGVWTVKQANVKNKHCELPQHSEADWQALCATLGCAATGTLTQQALVQHYAAGPAAGGGGGGADIERDLTLAEASQRIDAATRKALAAKNNLDLDAARAALAEVKRLKQLKQDYLNNRGKPAAAAPPTPKLADLPAAVQRDVAALFKLYDPRGTGRWTGAQAAAAAKHRGRPAAAVEAARTAAGAAGVAMEDACAEYVSADAATVAQDLALCKASVAVETKTKAVIAARDAGDMATAKALLAEVKEMKGERDLLLAAVAQK